MYKYTLAFIKRSNELLMINRIKAPWMGCWNGVGGKKELNESVKDCIKREILEETGIIINDNNILFKGTVTWNSFDAIGNGLYLFLVEMPEDFLYETPKVTNEGILDWKKIDWVSDFNNKGVAYNIPYFINDVIESTTIYNHKCYFENGNLISVKKEIMSDNL